MEAGDLNSNNACFYFNGVLRRQSRLTCKTRGKFTSCHVLLNIISLLVYMMDTATAEVFFKGPCLVLEIIIIISSRVACEVALLLLGLLFIEGRKLRTIPDILLASCYFQKSEYHEAILTLIGVIVPAIIIQIVSVTWHVIDGKKTDWHCSLLHVFLLQPFERLIVLFGSGVKYRGEKRPVEFYHDQTDVSLLCLFRVFLQSIHQIILQVYIMLYTDSIHWLTVTSVMISLFSFMWTVAIYIHTSWTTDEEQRSSHISLLLQTLSHTGIVTARLLSLSLFASLFSIWMLLFVGVHWILMVIWMVAQRMELFHSKSEKIVFTFLISIIYCYSFFSMKEHHVGLWLFAYHILMFCENAVCGALWYAFRSYHWYSMLILCTVCTFHILGVCSTVMYYYLYKLDLLKGTEPNVQITGLKIMNSSLPRDYQLHSTPTITKIQHKPSSAKLKKGSPKLGPITSTLNLAKRALLRSRTSSKIDIEFKPVATPSQLSPIKAVPGNSNDYRNIYTDCTALQLQDTSAFHHFSIDASACFRTSQCQTLEGTDINLSIKDDDSIDNSFVVDKNGVLDSEI